MGLNYMELMEGIKMGIFGGDHSSIYMLAGAVACIAASISLIWWYNKMLNDPYGRLDVSAVIKACAVLLLTFNFYSVVLIPTDYLVGLLTKGITSMTDNDKSGLNGKLAGLFISVEEAVQENTLQGQFEAEMAGMVTETDDGEGTSYGSSAVMEAKAETEVEHSGLRKIWDYIWGTLREGASQYMEMRISCTANVLSWVVSLVVNVVRYVLMLASSVYLIILGVIGPFVFALALLPGFMGNIGTWFARYIQISFWVPMAALVDFVNFKMKDAVVDMYSKADLVEQLWFPCSQIILLDIVTLVCLLAVPSMCAWVVSSSGASEANGAIMRTAMKALAFKK